MNTKYAPRDRVATEGVVAHFSRGGFGAYHRLDCPDAPHRGDPGVRDTIHGRPIGNDTALANQECLALYRDLRELAE